MSMKKLPKSELDVMKVIWKVGDGVSSKEVVSAMEEKNGWKRTTTLTLLSRLAEKGFVEAKKERRLTHYTALVNEKDYLKLATEDFLTDVHDGSLGSLFAALGVYEKVNNTEMEDLKKLLDDK
ncbi:MAG: BlaI/MecI/CopY family transcriptional regulator [Clostridium sp.]|nr:BlaI/MecI/CopY family transcriptional regulator [Clostridium sp.]